MHSVSDVEIKSSPIFTNVVIRVAAAVFTSKETFSKTSQNVSYF